MTAHIIHLPTRQRPAIVCVDRADDNSRAIFALFARRVLAALDAGVLTAGEAQIVCDVIEKMLTRSAKKED